jgi:3-hydroxy-9,10-secoandrosta-1,3,5(10)-triene-9,17-dione monooxygenase
MTILIDPTALPVLADASDDGARLLAGLRAMVPAVRARAEQAEAAGRIPDETINGLKDIDAFRAVVPKRYGGLELPYPYIPQIFRLLGRGCSSTAWSMGFLIYHNFQFGFFPLAAQDEVWGGRGFTMAPGQVMPSGKAERIEGGYRVSGRWGYATGINHGDWMLLSAPTDMGGGKIEMRRFYVPVENFTILDTWGVVAMKATGSHDVTLADEFVPEHRSVLVSDMREMRGDGLKHNRGPLWQMPLLSFMVLGSAGPFIGAAEALLEIVTDVMKLKVGAYSGDKQQGLMSQHIRIARLAMDLDATIRLWEGHTASLWDEVRGGNPPSRERRAEIRAVTAHVVANAFRVIDELARSVGSRSFYADNPIQRFHRDMASLSTHALFEYDHLANLYGGSRLGLDLPPNAMI